MAVDPNNMYSQQRQQSEQMYQNSLQKLQKLAMVRAEHNQRMMDKFEAERAREEQQALDDEEAGLRQHHKWASIGMKAGSAAGPIGAGIGALVGGVLGTGKEMYERNQFAKEHKGRKGYSMKAFAKDFKKTHGRPPSDEEMGYMAEAFGGLAGSMAAQKRQEQSVKQRGSGNQRADMGSVKFNQQEYDAGRDFSRNRQSLPPASYNQNYMNQNREVSTNPYADTRTLYSKPGGSNIY